MGKGKLVAALIVAGSVGTVLWRRRSARLRERVDLYFEDGSMVSLSQGSLEADRLLPLAHDVLSAARNA